MLDEKEIDSNLVSIGKEVTILRAHLNCTQQEFADLLLLSRVSISKLEQIQDVTGISPDIAFRLYYITQKISENQYKEDYVRIHAKNLQRRIDTTLQERITAP